MKIYEVYKKNKKAYWENKDIVLLQTMLDIDRWVKEQKIGASFIKKYKNCKRGYFMFSSVAPSIFFGISTGCVCTVMGNYMSRYGESQLFTIPTIIIACVLLLGSITICSIIHKHIYMNILLPYTIEKMEGKIKDHIESMANQKHSSGYKAILKKHRKKKK